MPKNIIICADGTGNTTIKGRGTNVFKLYEAVDQNGHRFDAAAIQQVACLFGDSRGAFTVRTLAGLVTSCGILDPTRYHTNLAFWTAVRHAYREYRRKYQSALSRMVRGQVAVNDEDLRRQFSVLIPELTDPDRKLIEFIGVWETVDAVGSPFGIADIINGTFYRFKFPNTTLSSEVAHACHALALDEDRPSFAPVLWHEGPGDAERIEQVWFTGSHANVGGGHPRQGISLVALDWMMWKAEAHGIRFLRSHRQMYRDATDVDDKLYEPRTGAGMFYRWRPRDVVSLCRSSNVAPKVHRSVFQRIARNTAGYAPGSLPPDGGVVTTNSPDGTAPIRQLIAAHYGDNRSLIDRERIAHLLGKSAYWLMIAMTTTAAAMILATYYADLAAIPNWRRRGIVFAQTIFSPNWLAVTARTIWHYPWVLAGALLAIWLNVRVDRHLDATYSEFWHRVRAPLRTALEQRPPGSAPPGTVRPGSAGL